MSFINFTKARCKNCYKCLRACPIKGIKFKDDQAEIVEERCIACGKCFEVCPQEARNVDSDLSAVKESLRNGEKLIVSLAPSATGYFDISFAELIARIKGLGFFDVRETAEGAQFVIDKYKEYVAESSDKIFITSCCPSVNFLIKIYYPHLRKYLMPHESPMIVHGNIIKSDHPDCKVVFIGPCIAKVVEKEKSQKKATVDYVITFDEVKSWLREAPEMDKELLQMEAAKNITEGRMFPVERGIVIGMEEILKEKGIRPYVVDGFHKNLNIFSSLTNGTITNAFVQADICIGSCIGGPKMGVKDMDLFGNSLKVERFIEEYAKGERYSAELDKEDYIKIHPEQSLVKKPISREQIEEVLLDMGKKTEEDKLNCGVCGYSTCEEKAKAIINGMSEKYMCLHYMRTKAESLSNIIFENTVNSVIIVDKELNILEMNPVAQKVFMAKINEYKGIPISTLIDDRDFKEVLESGEDIVGKTVEYIKYGVVFRINISFLEKEDVLIAVMMDITEEKKNRSELFQVKQKTLDAAQEVIEKQMRVAQEIAGLLGETTAETKITLNKLRRVVAGENGAEK